MLRNILCVALMAAAATLATASRARRGAPTTSASPTTGRKASSTTAAPPRSAPMGRTPAAATAPYGAYGATMPATARTTATAALRRRYRYGSTTATARTTATAASTAAGSCRCVCYESWRFAFVQKEVGKAEHAQRSARGRLLPVPGDAWIGGLAGEMQAVRATVHLPANRPPASPGLAGESWRQIGRNPCEAPR